MAVKNKTALLLVAADGFRDEEYEATRAALEASGARVTVASTVRKGARSLQNKYIDPDLLVDEVDPATYGGVVFIGGFGASQYWHDAKAHEIVRTLNKEGRLVAAIGRAPVVLGVSGLLNQKKVTGHISIYEKLANYGADYTGNKVEINGNIVTAVGPNAAKQFAKAVAEKLSSLP